MIGLVSPFFVIFLSVMGVQLMLADASRLQHRYLGIVQQNVLHQGVTRAFSSSPNIPTVANCTSPSVDQVVIMHHPDADLWVWRCQPTHDLHFRIMPPTST